MYCPHCDVLLERETLHGEEVDRCLRCGGLWLDRGELRSVVSQTCGVASASVVEPRVPAPLSCPKCRKLMVPFQYAHDSGIYIQQCAACAGVWVEPGQLELMAQFRVGTPATQRLELALSEELRAENRLEGIRGLLRSRVASIVVVLLGGLITYLLKGNLVLALLLPWGVWFPLLCIWFPEALGRLQSVSLWLARPVITDTTFEDFVALGGWLLLAARFFSLWIRP